MLLSVLKRSFVRNLIRVSRLLYPLFVILGKVLRFVFLVFILKTRSKSLTLQLPNALSYLVEALFVVTINRVFFVAIKRLVQLKFASFFLPIYDSSVLLFSWTGCE